MLYIHRGIRYLSRHGISARELWPTDRPTWPRLPFYLPSLSFIKNLLAIFKLCKENVKFGTEFKKLFTITNNFSSSHTVIILLSVWTQSGSSQIYVFSIHIKIISGGNSGLTDDERNNVYPHPVTEVWPFITNMPALQRNVWYIICIYIAW